MYAFLVFVIILIHDMSSNVIIFGCVHNRTCALWTWRRLLTGCPGGFCGGTLREVGVPGLLLRAIRSLYEHGESCVCIFGIKPSVSSVGVGPRQGCSLSLILFLV